MPGKNRFTVGAISALIAFSGYSGYDSWAGPCLRLDSQPAAQERRRLPPISVTDFRGAIPMGYGRLHFIAPGGMLRWNTWRNSHYIETVQAAIQLIEERAVGNKLCNNYFALMPKGRTFDQIWNGKGNTQIHISFSPGPSGTWRAATQQYNAPFDWTITESTLTLGPESVASALLLEASRVNSSGPHWPIAFSVDDYCGINPPVLDRDTIHRMGWAYWFSH